MKARGQASVKAGAGARQGTFWGGASQDFGQRDGAEAAALGVSGRRQTPEGRQQHHHVALALALRRRLHIPPALLDALQRTVFLTSS